MDMHADFVRRRKWLQQPVTRATEAQGNGTDVAAAVTAGGVMPSGARARQRTFVSRSDAMLVTPASAAKADDTRRSNVRISAGTAAKAFFRMLQVRSALRRGSDEWPGKRASPEIVFYHFLVYHFPG